MLDYGQEWVQQVELAQVLVGVWVSVLLVLVSVGLWVHSLVGQPTDCTMLDYEVREWDQQVELAQVLAMLVGVWVSVLLVLVSVGLWVG